MKRNFFLSIFMTILLAATMLPGSALALSTADALYSIQIVNVTFDGIELSPIGGSSYAYGSSSAGGASSSNSSSANPASVNVSSSGLAGSASATVAALNISLPATGSYASGSLSAYTVNSGISTASANSHILGSYFISGSGSITVKARYTLTTSVSGTLPGDAYNASSEVTLWAEASGANFYDYDEKHKELWTTLSAGAGSQSYSRTGYLTLIYDYDEPTTGTIAFGVEGHAYVFADPPNPVPEPAPVWLLGMGFLGLIGLQRTVRCKA